MEFQIQIDLEGNWCAYNYETHIDVLLVQLQKLVRTAIAENLLVTPPGVTIDRDVLIERIRDHVPDPEAEPDSDLETSKEKINEFRFRLNIQTLQPAGFAPAHFGDLVGYLRAQLNLLLFFAVEPLPDTSIQKVAVSIPEPAVRP